MKLRPLLVVMTIAGATTYAQQPVSLKDTLQWMHNFAADNGKQYVGQKNTDNGPCELGTPNCEQRLDVTTFDSKGCSATVTWSVTLNYENIGTHTYRFSLKDLDPKSVTWTKDRPFENAVITDTTNSAKKVNVTFTPPTGKTWDKSLDEPQTWVELVFDNRDDAKRFVKAFKHAIQLCGGKPSSF
jgi:hypothetical protein